MCWNTISFTCLVVDNLCYWFWFKKLCSCSYDDTSPHHPELCHYNIFNFYNEFPDWKEWVEQVENGSFVKAALELISPKVNITELKENVTKAIEVLEIVGNKSVQDCQEALFDFPFYFVGRWVFIVCNYIVHAYWVCTVSLLCIKQSVLLNLIWNLILLL